MNNESVKTVSKIGALLVLAGLTFALPQRAAADDFDPPGRVARLNYLSGSVSFRPAGESDWDSANLNRPMTAGDSLWTESGARAEMHIGSAAIRLGDNTGFSFLNLDDRTVQIELTEGTLNIRVRRVDSDEIFEVDTPNQAFSILQPGQYRIEASQDGNTSVVTVRSGQGEVTGGGRTYTVNAGLRGAFYGNDSLQANIYRASDPGDFDNWSQGRDRRDDSSQSVRYVSRDVVGYEDLDDNGSWSSDPQYGNVWMPRVAADWAPYREGQWAWISPWGWTWVDDEPWGYAPFHYGRWVNSRGRWGWVPGPMAVRPVYAPALVVFIGGPGFSLSISSGGRGGGDVGWFPLGPREVYVPGYTTSRAYVDRVNVSNTNVSTTVITNVYNIQVTNNERGGNRSNQMNINYANRSVAGGVTAVPQGAFISAQPIAKAAVRMRPEDVASASIEVRANVASTRQSVFGNSGGGGNRGAQAPAAIVNRTVVVKTAPPPPPISFERQQQKLAAQPGQPLGRSEVETLRPSNAPAAQPRVRQAPPGRPATPSEVMNQPGRTPPPAPAVGGPSGGPNQPGRSGRGQPSDLQPNAPPTPPAANVPAGRSDQPGRPGRGQPAEVQPSAPPTAPAANVPAGHPDQPGRPGRGQPAEVQPSAPPTAPVANVPAGRPDQPGRPGRGQPGEVQPNAPPTPPASNVPAGRPDQTGRPGRGQPAEVQPNAPQTAPAANAPAGRPGREQPGNMQPNAPPPPAANVAPPSPPPAKTPVNNPPPARDNRSGRTNQGQPANQPPAKAPDASTPAKPQAEQPTKETSQDAKDKQARDKKKQDDQSQQH